MFNSLKILPLPLLDAGGHQCVEISLETGSDAPQSPLMVRIIEEGNTTEQDLGELAAGNNYRELFLREVSAPVTGNWIFSCGESRMEQAVERLPVRRWHIFLVLHSHTDLGFTAPVSEVARLHNDNTDQVLIFCRETRHWPEGSRFKWTCEVSWQIENYIRERSPEKVQQLMQMVRKGSMEIGGLYAGELTEILGHEEALRSLYYAAGLRRRFNIPVDTVMLNDIPGCTVGFVQMMAGAGIQNFILADNNFTAPFLARTDLPRPFYWQGAANTEVLAWYTDDPYFAYVEGQKYGFADSYRRVRRELPQKLLELEKDGYPYEEYQIQYAFDNFRVDFRPAVIVREWNECWTYPQIHLATAREFLNRMRRRYSARLPRRAGDWTNWWGRVVAYYPYETALSRKLHQQLPQTEVLASLTSIRNSLFSYPSEAFEQAYHALLAFDEHTVGGKVWGSEDNEAVLQSVREGYGFIYAAKDILQGIRDSMRMNLHPAANTPGDDHPSGVVVINTLNWRRSGMVTLAGNCVSQYVSLRDLATGQSVPGEVNTGRQLRFRAINVAALGYKKFAVVEHRGNNQLPSGAYVETSGRTLTLKNEFYRVTVDRRRGEILSIYARRMGVELLRRQALPFNHLLGYLPDRRTESALGKFIPEIFDGTPIPGTMLPSPKSSKVRLESGVDTTGGAYCRICHELKRQTWLVRELWLQDNEEIVFLRNTLKRTVLEAGNLKESLEGFLDPGGFYYFVFPFHLPGAEFCYEAPGAVITPSQQQFKGTCRDHFAVQDWCRIANREQALTFCSPDAPILETGAISVHHFRHDLSRDMSTILVRFLAAGEWGSASESPYSRTEDLTFRFAFGCHDSQTQEVGRELPTPLIMSYQMGWNLQQDLVAIPLDENTGTLFPGNEGRFCQITPGNIQLMVLKRAQSGEGFTIRIREMVGVAVTASISFPHLAVKKAYRAQLTEEPLQRLKLTRNMLTVALEPFAIETLLIQFK